jgi:hypothetical protein
VEGSNQASALRPETLPEGRISTGTTNLKGWESLSPRVARNELPWVSHSQNRSYPEKVISARFPIGGTDQMPEKCSNGRIDISWPMP